MPAPLYGCPIAAALACALAACSPSKDHDSSSDAAGGSDTGDDGGSDASAFHFGITPGSAAALSGLCSLALLDLDAGMCSGNDAFVACAMNSCGIEACVTGACADYNDCLVNSADPCSGDCTPPAGCTCPAGVQSCALTKCLTILSCGPTDGGPCAALDRCCAAQPTDAAMSLCQMLAGVSKVRGDVACQEALDIMLDSGPFESCASLIDAGID